MKYLQIISEKIETKPFNLNLWLKNRIKDIDFLLSEAERATKLIDENENEGGSTFNYAVRSGRPEGSDIPKSLYSSPGWIIKNFGLERLKQSMSSYLQFGPDFLKYIIDTLKYIEPIDSEWLGTINSVQYAQQGLLNYGYEPGKPDTDNDPEYQAAQKLIEGWSIINNIIPKMIKLTSDIKKKIDIIAKRSNYTYRPEEYKPDHEDVEPLYHATAYVNEILKDGFQAEPPEERRGLGNYGRQDKTSFTHDYKIAHDIFRMLRDVWMISHNKLTAARIFEWMKTENINIDDAKKQAYWNSDKPIQVKTVMLYNYWLWLSKIRTNPVMTNPVALMNILKDREYDDIGILECMCKIEPKDEYRHGESEFRLPSTSVISMRRII